MKCDVRRDRRAVKTSLPVRGAWIEIILPIRVDLSLCVAPRAGSVD